MNNAKQQLADRIARLPSEKRVGFLKELNAKGISFTSLPIVKRSGTGRIPVSSTQSRMYFLWELDRESSAYHVSTVLRIEGTLDHEALARSFNGLVSRHEALRTVFRLGEDGQPEQVIQPDGNFRFEVRNLAGRDVVAEVSRIRSEPFDLTKGPLLRALLLRESDERYILAVVMHHIVSDDWTMKLLVDELIEDYRARVEGRAPTQAALPIQYADYAVWQRDWMQAGERDRQLIYWKEALGGDLPVLELATDHSRRAEGRYRQAIHGLELPAELVGGLRARVRSKQGTLFMGLLAGLQVLLHRYSGQEDILVGVPIANRHHAGTEGVVGVFINTQVLRTRLNTRTTLDALLEQVMESALGAQTHQDLPFEELVEALQPERSLSRTPLFQVMFNHLRQDGADKRVQLPGLRLESYGDNAEQEAKFELTVDTSETADGRVRVAFAYARELFESETIERMARHYVAVLRALVEDPDREIGMLDLLDATERIRLMAWGVNGEHHADTRPVHRLIEVQALAHPEAVALVFGEAELSYAELNARANRLSHRLIALGVGSEVRVGVALERSVELAVSLLAILKAGGAYVPLDPDYPAERLAYMVKDSGIDLLVTQGALRQRIPMMEDVRVIEVEHLDLVGELERNPEVAVQGSQLAYVIYTSGSTGVPKGIGITHATLVEQIQVAMAYFGLNFQERMLQFSTINFDAFVEQFFSPLVAGATVVLRGPALWDSETFYQEVLDKGITIADLPASYWHLLVQDFARQGIRDYGRLRQVHASGEVMPPEGVRAWREAGLAQVKLFNSYGPTETVVTALVQDCQAYVDGGRELPARMPIGHPLAGRSAYVLDGDLNLALPGVAAELYLGGPLLARGYLNREALTAERFVADPFDQQGGRLYRTGDLVKWNAEGELAYLGRIDDQVKIRGFRIELGEIEAKLLGQAEVREAVVVADEGPGGTRLIGYVSLHARIEAAELRERLGRELPEYMVPSLIMVLDALPLNANGKIDRRVLPTPELGAEGEYEVPEGQIEETLASIWAEVLEVERVGRNDDFFRLGGHSLLALKLLERIRAKGHAVQVRTLFEHPKLADFAQSISQGAQRQDVVVPPNLIPEGCERIEPEMVTLAKLTEAQLRNIEASVPGGAANIRDIYPLAPLQEGILFHHLLQEQGDVYITSTGLGFDTKARLEGFVDSFNRVIARHDILRTAILWAGLDEPVQVVWRQAELSVQWMDEIGDLGQYRVDVRQAPMIHALAAFDAGSQRWRMQLLAHHLVSDHTTLERIVQEIGLIRQGRQEDLPEPVSFRHFVAQARLGVSREEHEAYFGKVLGDVQEPTAPFGLLDVRGDGTRVKEGHLRLEQALAQSIRTQAKRYGVSAAALLHLAWALVLARTTGRDDVVFGTVLFGRMQGGEGAERALGMFINMLPLRVRLGERSIAECLKAVQTGLTEFLHHEHATLALAQKCSGVPAGTPLFSAMLNYRHSPSENSEQEGAVASAWIGIETLGGGERTNYPFELSVDDLGDGFGLTARVDRSVEPSWVCAAMQAAVARLVDGLAAHSHQAVGEMELLGEAERTQLTTWGTNSEHYPDVVPVHRLIEAQVAARPQATSLVFGVQELSYAALNTRANRLAHRLIALGVAPDVRVGVALERSAELVVSLLAILKAGGAYVPLDPDYPAERLAYMQGDSGIGLLLTDSALRDRVPAADGVQVVEIDGLDLSREPAIDPSVAVSGENLAYVIYTSGSTGKPKGAQLCHRNVSRLLAATEPWFHFGPSDVWTLFHSYAFDFSVWEMFGALCTGGKLVVVPYWVSRSSGDFLALLRAQQVTVLNQTPSAFGSLIHAVEQDAEGGQGLALKHVIFGGEALEPEMLRPWMDRFGDEAPRLINMYGITETTVHVTYRPIRWADLEAGRRSPVGLAIPDLGLKVLDGNLNLAPLGVPGELHVSGGGLARGYLNRSALTAERFVADPFDEAGGRLYRTGDLVKWNAQGALEYLGRIDHQVKIRGFRIELGEIEAKLLGQEEVRQAVVVAGEGPGGTRLVGYVSLHAPIEVAQLRERLGQELPEYIVPSFIMVLDALPLNANGKIDRKALPTPQVGAEEAYEAPAGELEETLAAVWADVLEVERVGRNDDFFRLGGHSLLALKLLERIRAKGHAVQVRTLFEHPKLADFAQSISQGAQRQDVVVPPNRIPEGCERIEPEMVTLATLTAAQLRSIEASVPGGAVNIQDIYPLAPLQEGILFHHLLQEQGDVYITHYELSFDTQERLEGFIENFNRVIARHDILRTAILWEGLDEPVQVVWRQAELKFQWMDEIGDLSCYRIDVRQAPLIHVLVTHDAATQRWRMQLLAHHLVDDNTTVKLIVAEIGLIQQGREAELPKPVPFRRFVAQARLGVSRAEHEAYFRERLSDVEEPTAPFGLLDVQGDGTKVKEGIRTLETDLVQGIRLQAQQHGVSAAALFHLAWALVLARTTGQDDVVFGTVLFGRMQGGEGADRALGMFINMLPLRVRLGTKNVVQCLRQVQAGLTELLHHEHATLALAQRCSGVPAGMPLFSAALNFRHAYLNEGAGSSGTSSWEGVESLGGRERTNYPFGMSVNDTGSGFDLVAHVHEAVPAEAVCGLLHRSLQQLVGALTAPIPVAIGELDLLGPQESERLAFWSINPASHPDRRPVIHRIEAQVQKRPDATAVVFADEELSYGEINARANRLAHHLIELGVGSEVRVGVVLERSVELVVSLLAILKAGGAYVPLDPDYPAERLAYMADDSGIALLLTHTALAGRIPPAGGLRVLTVDTLDVSRHPAGNPAVAVSGEHLMYVIYTSGSTGTPKGVAARHAAVSNCLMWMQQTCALAAGETVLHKTPFGFDASVWELFWPLTVGARLVVAAPGEHRDLDRQVELIREHQVTVISFVPTMLKAFLLHEGSRECVGLKHIMSGAETVGADLQRGMARRLPDTKLHNLYGPTETTIHVTHWTCGKQERDLIPIGGPITQSEAYVLDGNLKLAPQGVAGELYLGGVGLARGYLNRHALTAERFVANPFSQAGGRLYRSGDLVRWNVQGELEYLGRIDHQVKIRGLRIELGEIEAQLLGQPQVREAVVVVSEGAGGTRLVGYVSLHAPIEAAQLRQRLGKQLPAYMVPSFIMVLDALPLNVNGKIDRRALPAPEVSIEGEYEAPEGQIEETLAGIWAEVLEVERVGRNADFFRLGGHSLLALKLLERIRAKGYVVQVRTLFEHPKLADFAQAINQSEQRQDVVAPPNLIPEGCEWIEPKMVTLAKLTEAQLRSIEASVPGGAANIQDIYPLAPLQAGILFHHLLQEQGDVYITWTDLGFDTKARLEGFVESLNRVMTRHDILRTAVLWEELDEPVQVVWRRAELKVQWMDEIGYQGQYRIDVRQAPMIHALAAFDVRLQRWRLQLLAQHLVTDHTTLELIVQEIGLIRQGREEDLPEPVPFRRFVAQARLGVSQVEHEVYFGKVLGDVQEPTAPFGLLDVRGDGTRGKEAHLHLEQTLAEAIRMQAKHYGVSAAALFHLAWALVLARTTGRDDVVFGTVLFGRMQGGEGAERALGMFINMLPLRVRLDTQSIAECLQAVQAGLTELLHHEHATLALAQKCSGVPAGTPLFSAMLNYRHSPSAEGGQEDAVASAWTGIETFGGGERTNYPFELSVDDLGDGFGLTARVDRSVEPSWICEAMQAAVARLVDGLAAHSHQAVGEVELLGEAERTQLTAWGVNSEHYPDVVPVHRLIEAQVAARPQATSLVFGVQELSYAALNTRANRLAHRLIALGVGPEVRVGVALERSAELVVSLLAILKAGGAYVPLDPDYPAERLAYMVQDSGIRLLLTDSALRDRVPAADGVQVVQVDSLDLSREPAINPDVSVSGENLAYVIYTSGSTGKPKGAQLCHRNVGRLLAATEPWFHFGPSEVWTLFHSYAFDFSVWEMFGALCTGGKLVVVPYWVSRSPGDFLALLREQQVTVLNQTPSAFGPLIHALEQDAEGGQGLALKHVIFGGEALEPEMLRPWMDHFGDEAPRLINMYGITETTVHVTYRSITCADLEAGRRSPVGLNIPDLGLKVLDANLNLAPLGVPGELHVSGGGLARGYLNRSALTAERFVADPFDEAGGRLYRTGDLVKWNAEGELAYLGRIDHQVKIRGFRIELGEIEAKLLGQEEVRQAVVVAGEGPGGTRLIGYVSLHAPIEVAQLRERLGQELPEYMVPSFIMVLEALPLNANGKIDRKALPTPQVGAEEVYEAPAGELEETLAAIWADVLEVERVGRNDDFFRLGGHSLLALKLLERIRAKGHAVQVRTLFEHPKLADFAQSISQGAQRQDVVVPPNRIPEGCERIEPEMVTLAQLTAAQLRSIEASVPGGAVNIQDIYPLAPLQEGILFHHLLQEQGDVYITSTGLGFDTKERLEGFVDSFNRVIARHDILRTAILWEGLDEPVQVVWRRVELKVQWVDAIRDLDSYRIDVRQAPMIHARVMHNATTQRWHMHLLAHHLVSDHTTLERIVQEIGLIRQGRQEDLPEPVPFRHFVAQARLGVSREEHEIYFGKVLGDVQEPTVPFGLLDVRGDGTRIREAHLRLEQALAQSIRTQAKRYGVGAAALFHLAWALVLARTTGQDDVVFGTVLFGRMQGGEGADRALGMFINMLPLRVRLGTKSVVQCLRQVQAGLTELLHHEHATLALAQKCSGVPAGVPLFSAMLNYRHSPSEYGGQEGTVASAWTGIETLGGGERTNYPFELSVDDLGDGFGLTARVDGSVEPSWVCAAMQAAVARLVDGLAAHPHQAVGEIDMLGEAERMQLMTWSVNSGRYPDAQPVHRLIEAQVTARAQAVALVFGAEELSYAELNARANRLACRLIGQRVGPEVRVGVALERSIELVVSLLAIMKAGGAYVPLDPDYPAERLAYMVQDSGIDLLLTHSALRDRLPTADGVQVVEVDGLDLSRESAINPDVSVSVENLCYVIYTSGSTGKPKGAANRHRSLYNRLMWMQHAYGLDGGDTVLQKTPYSFDVSVWEFFWPLMAGARVAVAKPGDHRDPARLVEQIRKNMVTTLHFVPSMLRAFLAHEGSEACMSLRRIVCSGEALSVQAQAGVFARLPSVALYNLYGPTEAAIDVTHWTCRDDGNMQMPIGKPISDTKTYVLDSNLNLAPPGVVADLYLGGIGLARGYLNRSALTAERFVADPFSEEGDRLYRTGDLVKWNAEGALEYLGRIDHQVKIRGLRIELGEIEANLLRQPQVREAVVVAGEGPGGTRLVGYVSLHAPIKAAELRERLGKELPEYMVPSIIIVLDALPLSANGKIDRKALPASQVGAEDEYEAPEGQIEETLAGIWAEVLEVERVGRNDDFFRLGGHSLLALKLLERTRAKGHAVQVRTLFESPKLADFAKSISQGEQRQDVVEPPNLIPEGCEWIEPKMVTLVKLTEAQLRNIEASVPGGAANIQDIYPLAPLQAGILFHHLLQEKGDVYIMTTDLGFDTKERLEEFIASFNRVIVRHGILRTAVLWEELDEPVQVVWRRADLKVQWMDEIGYQGQYRIDVRQAPMIHALAAFDAGLQRWRLQLLAQHLVTDHTTLERIVQEIGLIRQGRVEDLPEPVSFRRFVAQARLGVSQVEHEAYFGKVLGDVEESTAPFGLLDVRGDGTRGKEAHLSLEQTLAEAIRMQAKHYGVSAAALFHLAWALVLARTTGRDDVVFGTVLFGRMQGGEGAERALGMFINMLPLRVRLGTKSVVQCLRQVQVGLMELLHHEHATLALAQRCSGVPAGMPLFSAALNFRHTYLSEGAGSSGTSSWEGVELIGGRERTNYPFGMSVNDTGSGFDLVAHVHEAVPAESVCGLLHRSLQQLVNALKQTIPVAIGELDLLGSQESERLAFWGINSASYPDRRPVIHMIEAQVQKRPDTTALVFADEKFSYGEINARANRLAHHLVELGVGPEVRVGVVLERSVEMVVSLLAILKAGGAYVPLDPDYPVERLAYMADDSGIALLLTHTELVGRIPPVEGVRVLAVDTLDVSRYPVENPLVELSGEHLMYVIYTSGSTGTPKGVAVRHAAVSNCLMWMQQTYDLAAGETVLHKAPFGFDVSVWELFWPLTVGVRLVVAVPGEHRDVERLVELIRDHQVTAINFVPMMLKAFLRHEGSRECVGLKHIMCGGEAVGADLQRDLARRLPDAKLHDLYGPTETTIHITHWTCGKQERDIIPIGGPITQSEAYVLDGNLNLAPQGVAGELYLGGAGLARGYLNRHALTAERFVANSFSQAGGRLYRSGDLVRWNAQGELEYLGRIDHQVKIRGFRIELGEIEAKLLGQPQVREAVVVASEGAGGTRLVGYVSLHVPIEAAELREYLGRELPAYMVPSLIMTLDALPLNANGKIDRRALPAPQVEAENEYEAPVGEAEEALARIWSDVLKVPAEAVGRTSNFFELGGDSILSLQVISRAKATGHSVLAGLHLRQLMLGPTIASLLGEAERSDDSLVSLNRANTDTVPLFCIHSGLGGIFDYRRLAERLEGVCRTYGLACPMLGALSRNYESLEEMADEYVAGIQRKQPQGPYHLLGWSLGGALAVMIAARLEEQNESVGFLGMIDSFIPGTYGDIGGGGYGTDWKEDFKVRFQFIVPGFDIAEDLPDQGDPEDVEAITHLIDTLIGKAEAIGSARKEAYSLLGAEDMARMFIVERRLSKLSARTARLPGLRAEPSYWWARETSAEAKEALGQQLGSSVKAATGTVIQADHLEIIHDPVLLNAVVASLRV